MGKKHIYCRLYPVSALRNSVDKLFRSFDRSNLIGFRQLSDLGELRRLTEILSSRRVIAADDQMGCCLFLVSEQIFTPGGSGLIRGTYEETNV